MQHWKKRLRRPETNSAGILLVRKEKNSHTQWQTKETANKTWESCCVCILTENKLLKHLSVLGGWSSRSKSARPPAPQPSLQEAQLPPSAPQTLPPAHKSMRIPRIVIPLIIVLYLSAPYKSSVTDDVFKLPRLQLNPEGWLSRLPETSNATLPCERSTPRLEAYRTRSLFFLSLPPFPLGFKHSNKVSSILAA